LGSALTTYGPVIGHNLPKSGVLVHLNPLNFRYSPSSRAQRLGAGLGGVRCVPAVPAPIDIILYLC